MKNLYKIQDELYIIDNNEKVTQNGIWAKCSFTGDILKNRNGQYAYKVILTTNNLLIKDGVQKIDDEFLEWFVKNPSCEWVEIDKNWNYPLDKSWEYKIIIPKEEPKQTVQEYEQQGLEKHSYELEPKQELLEEAAEIEKIAMDKLKSKWEHLYTFGYPKKPFPTNYENDLNNVKVGLYEGAKWQAERMYSEAIEFAEWIRIKDFQTTERGNWIGLELRYYTTEELFEQFKKK